MRLKSSHIFALAILGAVVLFFIIGTALNAGRKHTAEAKPAAPAATALPSVQVARIAEAVHPYEVVIRGRTQAARVVQVRSETSGVVAGTPVLQGGFVHKGDVLCRLNVDARAAAVA